MKPLKTKISISLDDDLVQLLRQLAVNDGRSFSQYINLILRRYIYEEDENIYLSYPYDENYPL